jgi:DNA repair protein RadC
MANRRDVSDDETPRGRLLRRGAQALSDAELLSILLRTEHGVAGELLDTLGGLYRLTSIDAGNLRGTSSVRTAALLAAVEFGRRLARAQVPKRIILRRMPTTVKYLRLRYDRPNQEVMGALYLDCRHRLIHEEEIFRGALTHATVEPRAILQVGLMRHAARLILFHTHPSGTPEPSQQDIGFSHRMNKACQLVGIVMEDHIILGVDGWASIKAQARGAF